MKHRYLFQDVEVRPPDLWAQNPLRPDLSLDPEVKNFQEHISLLNMTYSPLRSFNKQIARSAQ